MQLITSGKALAWCAVFPLFLVAVSMGAASAGAGYGQPQPGTSYRIIRQVYLTAVYESMAAKSAGKGAAIAYLEPERYYKTRWVAFQCEVPAGTVMTIIGSAPSAKDLWSRYDAYYVQLNPNPSKQLDVIVQLFRGFDDASGGFSAEFFERVSASNDPPPASNTGCAQIR